MMAHRSADARRRSARQAMRPVAVAPAVSWAVCLSVVLACAAWCGAHTLPRTRSQEDASLARFFHVSDFHLEPLYDATGDARHGKCRSPEPHSAVQPRPFGQYGCDAPEALVQSAISVMKQIESSPAFIIMTGDMAAHDLPKEQQVLDSIARVSQLLHTAFASTPVVVSIGNNDLVEDYVLPSSDWLGKLADRWSPFFPDSNAESEFRAGGYYEARVTPSLSVVALNTVVYSPKRVPFTDDSDPIGQFAWLRTVLDRARAQGRNVFITGHIAPGSNTYHKEELWDSKFTDTYLSLVDDYLDVVSAHFFGHMHRDDFRVIWDNSRGDPREKVLKSVLFEAPSISPVSNTNPSFRLMHMEAAGAQLIDYDQYYSDVINNQIRGNVHWALEYSFRDAYNQTSLAVDKVESMYRQMQRDPILFNAWIARRTSQYSPERFEYYCAISELDRPGYETCMDQVEARIGPL